MNFLRSSLTFKIACGLAAIQLATLFIMIGYMMYDVIGRCFE